MNLDELWRELEEALTLAGDNVALIEQNSDHIIDHWSGIQILALAHQLRALLPCIHSTNSDTAPQQQLVGIYLENSAIYVGAVLAAVSSGHLAFLPLDPRWPTEKLLKTLETFRPECIFYGEKESGVLGACGPPPQAPSFFNDNDGENQCCRLLSITPALIASARAITTTQALEVASKILPNSTISRSRTIAYVLTTSGSTATATTATSATAATATAPLGVCGTALGIYQRCTTWQRTYPFQKGDVVAFKTNPCFVDSIWEIFGPLLSGGTAVILAVPFSISVNPYSLVESLVKYNVTHMTAVPTVWQQIVNACSSNRRDSSKLRQVVSSGEQLPWQLLFDLREKLLPRECRILNLYGTTEVAADATVLDCSSLLLENNNHNNSSSSTSAGGSAVPVGVPLEGVVIALAKVRDENGEQETIELVEVRSGAEGEVLIGGWGVAAGYYNPPSKNNKISTGTTAGAVSNSNVVLLANKFIHLDAQLVTQQYCLGSISGSTIVGTAAPKEESKNKKGTLKFFRSGDLGKIDDHGRLCILGRRDLQIKINGVRVDLLEVEEVMRGHRAVHAVAVKIWPAAAAVVEGGEEEIEKFKQKRILGVYLELENEFSTKTTSSNVTNGTIWNELKSDLNSLCASKLSSALLHAGVDFYFENLVKLPRSSGGKIDRSALLPPPPLSPPSPLEDEEVPRDVLLQKSRVKRMKTSQFSEVEVHRAFAAALGHSNFEPISNLFTVLGGTSITAVSIAGILGIEVEQVFQNPTVRSLTSSFQNLQPPWRPPPQPQQQQWVEGKVVDELVVPVDVPELQLLWKAKMKECVDTTPLFFQQKKAATAAGGSAEGEREVVFAASHGGDVSCFDASSGAVLWHRNIPNEQPDPGMAILDLETSLQPEREALAEAGAAAVLAVGLNSGKIKFLDAATGEEIFEDRRIDVGGGGMRAAPAVGSLRKRKNLLWAAGHGKELVVINNQAQVVATLALPAAVSAGVLLHDSVAFVACLDGTLMAVKEKEVQEDEQGPIATMPSPSQQLELSVVWKHACGSPIFATPTIVNRIGASDIVQSIVVAVTASGAVVAVDVATRNLRWHKVIDPGGYYIPALYLQNANMILVGSHSGKLTWVDVADGSIKRSYRVVTGSEAGGTGGGAITGMMVLPSSVYKAKDYVLCIVVSTGNGQILLLNSREIRESTSGDGAVAVNVAARFQLPNASFSHFSYGRVDDGKMAVYTGCRDDHLYCFILPEI